MSVITVSCSPKTPQQHSSSELHHCDMNYSDSALSAKGKKADVSLSKAYENDYLHEGNVYDTHLGTFGNPTMNTLRQNLTGHNVGSSSEFYRTPLADRTHYERQSYNTSRSSNESNYVNNFPSDLKNVLPQNSSEKTIRIYAHNPYEPILLRDKDDEYVSNNDLTSDHGPSTSIYQDASCYPSSSLHGMPAQQTPQKSTMDTSNHSIQYVNGRPVVVGTSTATLAPSTGTSPSSLMATTPSVGNNPHDLSFDGVQSVSGAELFEYPAEEDMVALVEDLSAPTNERFQQPQLRIHTPVSTIKSGGSSNGYASSATKPATTHRRHPADSYHASTEAPHSRTLRDGGRSTSRYAPSHLTPSNGAGYSTRHPIHALSRTHRTSHTQGNQRSAALNKTPSENLNVKPESVEVQNHVECDLQSSELTSTTTIVRVCYRERTVLYRSEIQLEVGDYCVVQGDRGFDLGRVIDVQPCLKTSMKKDSTSKTSKEDQMERVLRKATDDEVQTLLTTQRDDEERALECIRDEVRRLNLSMNVKYCEYQFDRQKLCFYFESKEKIMFVPLLKYLHREYQCRIWLQQINRGEGSHNSDL